MSVRLMEGVIAAAMPTWHPAQFIQRPEDGSWFTIRAADLSNLRQVLFGATAVVSNADPIGEWKDQLQSRYLGQSHLSFRPRWDATNEAVEFHQIVNVDPRSLNYPVPVGEIDSDSDITIMGVMQSDAALGAHRAAVGVGNFVAGNNYVALARNSTTTLRASVDPYSVDPNKHIHGTFSDNTFAVFSVTRSKVLGGKLVNLYINGVLGNAGPSVEAGGTAFADNIYYVLGPQYDAMNPTHTFRIKDLIIAYKKAQVTDHVGYYQYALSNGLI